MGAPTKRALVHNPYWNSLGGGERYVACFVKLLLHQGWQVDLDWPEDISGQILERFNIDISSISHNSKFQIHNSKDYDLVFWVSDGSLPTSFAKKTLIHLQVPFQSVDGTSWQNFIKSRFYTFVSNSKFTKKIVDQEYSINSKVIYPPISVENFTPSKKKLNNIVYIGRFSNLTQSKGHDILISEFKKIHSTLSGWKLVLMGGTTMGTQPEYLQSLKDLARQLPVEFVFDPHFSTIKKTLETSKIFWSAAGFSKDNSLPPAKQEHFGISLVEAMAAGCVPIVPNRGGHPEIVDHDINGFLYDSLSEFSQLTLQLTTDNQQLKTMSQAAVEKSKIFSEEKFNQKFLELI